MIVAAPLTARYNTETVYRASDTIFVQHLQVRRKLTAPTLNETMEHAFGSSMKTVGEEELKGSDAIYNFHFPHIISFLKEIERKEIEKN